MAGAAGKAAFARIAASEVRIVDTVPALSGGVSTTNHPLVVGRAPPLALATLYLNGAAVGSGLADATGAFSIALPAQLNGGYSLLARAMPTSAAFAITINDPLQPLTDYLGRAAVYDQNALGGLYYGNGQVYGSASDLVAGLGGSVSGITAIVGGYVSPGAVSLASNGTFDTATTGWTAIGSAALAIAGGQMQMTQNATGDGFVQAIAGYPGRAFAFTGTGARGTNAANSPALAASGFNGTFSGNYSGGPAVASTTPATATIYTQSAVGIWVGVKGSAATGTTLWDDFIVREAMPMPGWASFATASSAAATSWAVLLDFVTPAALPTSGQVKMIWQGDTNNEISYVKAYWDATGHVHVKAVLNNAQTFDFDLGAVAAATRARVALTAAAGANGDRASGYAASLNGANAQALYTSATYMIAPSHMRIGKDSAGTSAFDGTLNRVAVVQGRAPADWLEYQAALPSASPLWTEGDSYMDGAGGVVLTDKLETALARPAINSAVGGSTFAAIRDRIFARPYLRSLPLVIWDGSNNGMTDVASQVAIAQAIWDWKGDGRIVFMPSIPVPNPGTPSSATVSAYTTMLQQYRNALIAAFGAAHVWDPMPTLQALTSGSADDVNDIAAGMSPRSIMLTQNNGEVHLGNGAMNAVAGAATLQAKIAAL